MLLEETSKQGTGDDAGRTAHLPAWPPRWGKRCLTVVPTTGKSRPALSFDHTVANDLLEEVAAPGGGYDPQADPPGVRPLRQSVLLRPCPQGRAALPWFVAVRVMNGASRQ